MKTKEKWENKTCVNCEKEISMLPCLYCGGGVALTANIHYQPQKRDIHLPDTITGRCFKCGKNRGFIYGKYCDEFETQEEKWEKNA